MTTTDHELDRRDGETNEQYNERIETAAREAGQSRVEYERAANERAGRPARNAPGTGVFSDGQDTTNR